MVLDQAVGQGTVAEEMQRTGAMACTGTDRISHGSTQQGQERPGVKGRSSA
jgi:hypothetical protein